MIEFRSKEPVASYADDQWYELYNVKKRFSYDFEFTYCMYRINGVVYNTLTSDFVKAFEKEKVWSIINNAQ